MFLMLLLFKKIKMKKAAVLFLFLLLVVAVSYSCSNQTRRSRKPVSSITILPAADSYHYGTAVNVKVETKLRNGEISSIKLFHNGNLIEENKSLDFTTNKITLDELGNNTFHVVATKTDDV